MIRIKRLIIEAHRRSLWQVLSIYLVGSWIAIQVVQALTHSAGLPGWVPGFALALLLLGLPMVLATAFVQEGGPGGAGAGHPGEPAADRPTPRVAGARSPAVPSAAAPSAAPPAAPSAAMDDGDAGLGSRLFTWRNALAGGVLAFALLGVVVTGYFAMRTLGIGPVASLRAQGVFDERERILIADFENATPDPVLGDVVTSALRIDLSQSRALAVVDLAELAPVLRRMQRAEDGRLPPALAREIAEREGMKAVLEGEVGALGTGYVVQATLRAVDDGRSLAGFRVTARDGADLIDAVDKLSRQIRERAGESLRAIRAGPPLGQVTTASLDALRKFTQANGYMRVGEPERAVPLLEEAVALDTAFAMGWRTLGIALSNVRVDRTRQLEAFARAYRHRDRLTDAERYLAAATYHSNVTRDREQTIQAYRSLLRLNPADGSALNNLANEFSNLEQFPEAERLYRQALAADPVATTHYNLVFNLMMQDRLADARVALAAFHQAFPGVRAQEAEVWLEYFAGDLDGAEAAARRMADSLDLPAVPRAFGHAFLATIAHTRGRMDDGLAHIDRFARVLDAESPGGGIGPRLVRMGFEVNAGPPADSLVLALDALVESEDWRAHAPAARFYHLLLPVYAAIGARDRVLRYLAEWESEVPLPSRGGPRWEHERAALLGILALAEGRPDEAVRELENARAGLPCHRCFRQYLAAAYDVLDRPADAIAVYESMFTEIHAFPPMAGQERTIAVERLGPLYEDVGLREEAVRAYARFVDLWHDADPELQPRVRSARRALDRLVGEP